MKASAGSRAKDLLGELAPEQRTAVRRLARRLDTDTTDVLVRLVGAALFVAGQDAPGVVDLSQVLRASVPKERFAAAYNALADAFPEFHDWAIGRTAEERLRAKGAAA